MQFDYRLDEMMSSMTYRWKTMSELYHFHHLRHDYLLRSIHQKKWSKHFLDLSEQGEAHKYFHKQEAEQQIYNFHRLPIQKKTDVMIIILQTTKTVRTESFSYYYKKIKENTISIIIRKKSCKWNTISLYWQLYFISIIPT